MPRSHIVRLSTSLPPSFSFFASSALSSLTTLILDAADALALAASCSPWLVAGSCLVTPLPCVRLRLCLQFPGAEASTAVVDLNEFNLPGFFTADPSMEEEEKDEVEALGGVLDERFMWGGSPPLMVTVLLPASNPPPLVVGEVEEEEEAPAPSRL